ncbi:CLUMA_CG005310, isoform A [Clunio marinus]|uniref:NudC domain-containing protein 1 n=1 Tax=Clunio marinus TaxID=568069 RepID=A0A1J1HWC5_9DIPT|nr:CLUMA_CG005310, isoform A [Clunio marinus]
MKIFELRPDSNLLKCNFDGYKLSLEPIPILKSENIPKPDRVLPDTSSEYSFLHSSLYQLHNHLVADPWLHHCAYYIDVSFVIHKIQYDTTVGRVKQLTPVYRCAIKRPSNSGGIYNSYLKFISEKYAVLSDGIGGLRILDTGDRQKNNEWKEIKVYQPLNSSGFIIQDAKFAFENGVKTIHMLLQLIEQIDGKFHNIIHWLTYVEDGNDKNWREAGRRTLQGKGSLHYLSLDPKCKAFVYSSNYEYKYTNDSFNEIIEEIPVVDETTEKPQNEESENSFTWTQNGEDITINFNQQNERSKNEFQVKCEKSHIEVKYQNQALLCSDLFAEVDTEMTTWSLENDFMQLNLVKKDTELIWPYLIPGGPPADSINEKQSMLLSSAPISDLNTQMEECDYGDDGHQDEEFFIERLDVCTHKSSHKVFLASNHPLFSTTLRPGYPQAVAVRSDVDCCLWLQQVSSNDEWSMKHESTLHAFGYIQASKRERKFLACSPDTNLAVICESSRHLFIYKNSYNTAGGLRKRSGPQLTIGQQKLVSFDGSNGEILGIVVDNEIILLLTENAILCLQLSIEE